jgi:hypothetical protein
MLLGRKIIVRRTNAGQKKKRLMMSKPAVKQVTAAWLRANEEKGPRAYERSGPSLGRKRQSHGRMRKPSSCP